MPKTKEITPKQQKFVAEYVKNGGNATAAAKVAYPEQSEKSAAQQGWQNLQKLELAKAIRQEFAKQGVTLDKAIRPIVKGLEAKDKDGNLYYLENPNGKWDWWMVGGRYSGYLIDKNKVTRVKCKVKEVSFDNILDHLKEETDGRLHHIEDTAPYAFLHDGRWTQIKASHDEAGVGAKVFFEMFNSLDPETEITIIDYHM